VQVKKECEANPSMTTDDEDGIDEFLRKSSPQLEAGGSENSGRFTLQWVRSKISLASRWAIYGAWPGS
jgi:hypothetical protein